MDATSTSILSNMLNQFQPLWNTIGPQIFIIIIASSLFIVALGTFLWYVNGGIKKLGKRA